MKKICFIATLPTTLESFVLGTAMYLHKNTDWDISFICSYDRAFEEKLPKYIHYFPVKMERGISLTGVRSAAEMLHIFQREKFDLVQYATPNASLYAALAGKIAGVPVRLYCQWGMVFVGFSGIKRKIFKLEEKLVCRLSNWIEPDSRSNLKFAHSEKLYPPKVGSVIWNGSACGVNLEKFDISRKEENRQAVREKYNIPKDAFVFGFVGRLTRDKGINELFEAAKSLIKKQEKVYLIVVGGEEGRDTLNQQLYRWSKKCSRVIYTGYTDFVEQYLSAMDCYVLPSYREGFGMGVIEAEAMGLPVIVTDIPGPVDAVKKDITGFVVKKADADDLKKAMEHMAFHRETAPKFGKEGSRYVRESFEQQKLFACIKSDRERLMKKAEDKESKKWRSRS